MAFRALSAAGIADGTKDYQPLMAVRTREPGAGTFRIWRQRGIYSARSLCRQAVSSIAFLMIPGLILSKISLIKVLLLHGSNYHFLFFFCPWIKTHMIQHIRRPGAMYYFSKMLYLIGTCTAQVTSILLNTHCSSLHSHTLLCQMPALESVYASTHLPPAPGSDVALVVWYLQCHQQAVPSVRKAVLRDGIACSWAVIHSPGD